MKTEQLRAKEIRTTLDCYLYDWPSSDSIDSEWSAEAWQCLSQAEQSLFGDWDTFHEQLCDALTAKLQNDKGIHPITGSRS